MQEHVPPVSPALRARPIERELPISEPGNPVVDRLPDLLPPPLRRAVSLDDLLRRD
jgi:hypothetical protein